MFVVVTITSLTACTSSDKTKTTHSKPKATKIVNKKAVKKTKTSSSSSSTNSSTSSSSSSSSNAPQQAEQSTQPETEQPSQAQSNVPIDGYGPTPEQIQQAQAQYGYTPGYGGIPADSPYAQEEQARENWHDSQVEWGIQQGYIDANTGEYTGDTAPQE